MRPFVAFALDRRERQYWVALRAARGTTDDEHSNGGRAGRMDGRPRGRGHAGRVEDQPGAAVRPGRARSGPRAPAVAEKVAVVSRRLLALAGADHSRGGDTVVKPHNPSWCRSSAPPSNVLVGRALAEHG